MKLSSAFVFAAIHLLNAYAAATGDRELVVKADDPCAVVGGQKWVAPKDLRACFTSFAVDPEIKSNIIEVVNKTIAFHTSVNYEVSAPEPFTQDVHEDLLFDLARISSTAQASDFDLHVDLSRTFKRLNDGHCVYINDCYDSLFLTFVPTPVVLLTDEDGTQNVHIAPEAFAVASAEFPDELDVWQAALPDGITLSDLSGAKVLKINGDDPNVAVDANAQITGSFQGLGTRQNSFFSSYNRGAASWTYIMGNFAQQSLPLVDSVSLTIQRVNSTTTDEITLPYRSRIGSATVPFTDSKSFRANNCVAVPGTNGVDINADTAKRDDSAAIEPTAMKFRQAPKVAPAVARKHPVNTMLDTSPLQNVVLPPALTPVANVPGSSDVSQFNLLPDGKTGVLALGSFVNANSNFNSFERTLLTGLQNLKSRGATQLIVDVTNNGGGFICIAHFLHRIISGPRPSTVPQAGLNTTSRAGPLAQLVAAAVAADPTLDPNQELLYNPLNFGFVNDTQFPATFDWLGADIQKKVINGREDAFSMLISDVCDEAFTVPLPSAALFDPTKVAIVSNGRCASSCSLLSVTMAKEDGAKMVVVGGRQGVQQEYCGTVGGQSTDFSTIDTDVKTAHLKNNSLAPPDFKTNSVQGITWRLGFGIQDPTQPEEWQDHPADVNLPLTADIVNNPLEIWNKVAATVLA